MNTSARVLESGQFLILYGHTCICVPTLGYILYAVVHMFSISSIDLCFQQRTSEYFHTYVHIVSPEMDFE